MGIKDHDSMTLYYAVGVYGWVLDCFPLTFWKKKKRISWRCSRKVVHYILNEIFPNNVPLQPFIS